MIKNSISADQRRANRSGYGTMTDNSTALFEFDNDEESNLPYRDVRSTTNLSLRRDDTSFEIKKERVT